MYNLKTGIDRNDLKEKYPDYEYGGIGFSYNLDTVKLNNGVHILKFDFNGVVKEQKIVVNNYNQTLVLDKFDTSKVQGFMKITGYAITAYSNLSSFDYSIYIDNNKISDYYFDFKSDLSREELKNEYPYCNNLKNCGFKYIFDTRSLQDGKHKITIKCKNVESTVEFTVDNSNYNRELDTNSEVTFDESFIVMNKQLKITFEDMNSELKKMCDTMEAMYSEVSKKVNTAIDEIDSAVNIILASFDMMNSGIKDIIAAQKVMNNASNEMINAQNKMIDAQNEMIKILADSNTTLDEMNNACNEMLDGMDKINKTNLVNQLTEVMLSIQRLQTFVNNQDAYYRETYIQYTPQNDNIFESFNNKIVNYISTAVEHMVYGNFTDKINVLGVGGDIVLGVFDVDLPGDLRDVSYDVSHWEWSWNNAAEIAMDGIGLLPVVGVIKYGDKIGLLVKDGEKSVKTVKIKDILEEILQDSEKENNSIIKNGGKVISEGGADIIKNGNLDDLPDNALEMFQKYEKSGWQGTVPGQTPGTAAGSKYLNKDGKLPTMDSTGNSLTYKEFDVNNKQPNAARDEQRFVKGSDGSIYYTDNHYSTFIKVK